MTLDKTPSLAAASTDNNATPRPVRIRTNLDGTITGLLVRRDRPTSPESAGEEQALGWHEVIELQTFSERKAWIEEKIKVQCISGCL